jgi:chromosome segregation protein
MRIKRLDVTGFKSFMEQTVFQFDEGVTAIVGPNGCGKSNVVDAIRWAMGEQSAKNLRGRGMEDVIFNGSESKAPLSMAEVSLTFGVDPHDALAPQYAGFPDITVTRRLFRSGESEYLINKTVCRLLDITELFLGTGVGTRAYSIIEQGRVGQIVSARPEDRRSLIEEAAGVTKYKSRRKAAERRMELTQQNLARVSDVVGEQQRRLESLGRQAKKAEKYKKLKAEAREIELHTASHRFLELHAEAKVLAARLEALSTQEREGLEAVRELESRIEARRGQMEIEAVALQQLQDELHAADSQIQLDDQNLAHWTSDLQDTRRRQDEAKAEREALIAQREKLTQTAAGREDELRSLTGAWKEDEVALQVAQEEQRRVGELKAELAQRLESERAVLVEVATQLANQESKLTHLAAQRADLDARRTRAEDEAKAFRQEGAALEESRGEVSRRVGETRQLALDIAQQRNLEEDALARTRQFFAENEVEVIRLREELSDRRSRLQSLQEIQRNYEGFDRGVRSVMMQAGESPREHGIYGLVTDVLAAAPRAEKAIEAALGERLQHVVVESRERGLALVEYLKSASEGRSSFVPIALSSALAAPAPDLTRPGVIGAALDEVQCDEMFRPLVRALLGDVVLMADLASARAYAAEGGGAWTLVTLEGEVLRPDGAVTGGTMEGPAVGALQKKREIAELAEEVQRVEAAYNEIVTRHYALQKQMGHSEGVLKGLAKNQHTEELNLATQEKDLHKASEDLARIRERVAALDAEGRQLGLSQAEVEAVMESSRGAVAHGQTERETREEYLRQMGGELEGLERRASTVNDELTQRRVKVAENGQRQEALQRELEQMAAQQAELEVRAERRMEEVGQAEARAAELSERIGSTRTLRDQRGIEREGLATRLDAGRTAQAQAQAEVREEDGRLRELRTQLDELGHGLSDISLKEKEISLELVHLVDQVRERHQAELTHALHEYHLMPRVSATAEQRLKDLRQQIERMGEINVTAIEELAELTQRFEFLSTQKKDLEASLEQLHGAILKINRTSRERFAQTFEAVNEKFQKVFPRLFGGGRAQLVLSEEAPGMEQGVEIVAQPPGKKLQSMNLLSGGEKALTAVSLILAIFLIKPTPFCLLDEVDAPLDDANVGRYNEIVREMSQQSQFILITHNKRTMEIGDTLYGVTMEEPGISKLVSVRMREAAAANDNVA